MYGMTVSESGESGSVQLINERGETLPVVFHFFGKENVDLYNNKCTDDDRLAFMKHVALQLVQVGLILGGTFEDWVTVWNAQAAAEDKPSALEFIR